MRAYACVHACVHAWELYRYIQNFLRRTKIYNLNGTIWKHNTLFKLEELISAITKSADSTVGPYELHCQMLKHLPDITLETLLHTMNDCWISGSFPASWHQEVILPIPKVDKDRTDPNSYRTIVLTSCLCKVVEQMLNSRLVWYLEKNKIVTKMQSGFRRLGAPQIRLYISKPLFAKLLFINNMLLLSFLIWRRHTIQHWNMELCKIYSMQVLEDAYFYLFRASYKIDNSVWDLVTTNLISLIRRWVFRKAASCQLLCLHLRLTLSLKILPLRWWFLRATA